VNPLKLPWATKSKPKVELELTKKVDPPYRGLRPSRQQSGSGPHLLIEVRGVRAASSGPYRVEFSEGATLRHYMRQLRLLHAASYSAIYDNQYPERGRLRLTYKPQVDSRITIVPPQTGTATRLQRSHHDVARLMSRMAEDHEVVLGPNPKKSVPVVSRFGPPKIR
jgi:hypothetical protein